MAFNRDRFKAAKLEVNKNVTEEVSSTFKNASSRGDYHEISEGVNVFRLLPPHNEGEPSWQPKCVYWLEMSVEDTDEKGQGKGTFSVKNRPIFDARIHGGQKKDIVDEYIKFAKKQVFDLYQDKDLLKEKLAPINGWRGKDNKWHPGITASQSYVAYATKGDIIPDNVGRLELWKSDLDKLERLNISEEIGEPIVTDLFSDPDDGIQFIILRQRDKNNKWENIINKKEFSPKGSNSKEIGEAYNKFRETQRVSDEVLQKLEGMQSLSEQFRNTYKSSDFTRALDALESFDKKHKFNVFENDEFLDIVEGIESELPQESSTVQQEEKLKRREQAETIIKDSLIDVEGMTRDELKKYISENEYPITVVPTMSDELIKEAIMVHESKVEVASESIENTSVETSSDLPYDNDKSEVEIGMKDRLSKFKKKG